MENISPITIKCADGFMLSATLYKPLVNIKAGVMIAPATGIKQTFYNSFAIFLAQNGYGVICFDNRGIGRSKKGLNKLHDVSLIAWGKLDMTAVLNKIKKTFPNTSYHLIGHSAGGQLAGLMDNAKDIKSMFNFASSSGRLSNMSYPFKLKAAFFLNVFIPISNLLFGQANSQWIGMGEPLPKKIASQWSKWCNGAGYVATDFGKEILEHSYDDMVIPSMWMYATDDGISNLKNLKDMARVYSKSSIEILPLKPKELGFQNIGHMKFFSKKYQKLWKFAIDWLEEMK